MIEPLRAALVGCGSVSQRGILPHLHQADAREQVRVVAVVDAVRERAQAVAERFDVPLSFASIEELLVNADVDVVLIATPIPSHFGNALAAIQAGKHVYVQKTMTSTLAEANELLAARDRVGVKLAAAPGFEICQTTSVMRRAVSEGALGVVYLAYSYTMGFGHAQEKIRSGAGALAKIDPSWYYRRGGGPVPDVTVYALQLLTSVLGPVRRVTALANCVRPERTWRGNTISLSVQDNNLLLLEFVSNALAVAVGADCRGSERIPWGGLGLYGADGALEITDVDFASGYPLGFEIQGGIWSESTRDQGDGSCYKYASTLADQPYMSGAHLEIEEPHVYADIMDLVEAIRANRAPRASGEQARHVVEIIEKAFRAIESGQTQTLESTFAQSI
jgi:predicted dehydrogenase